MRQYFNLRYEFDKDCVHNAIDQRIRLDGSDYVCVADGVILDIANRDVEYCKVVNDGMFCICDSSYVPLYIHWIYGERYEQYSGSHIFENIIREAKYRMMFLGSQQAILDALQTRLCEWNPSVAEMQFVELPFRKVEDFDYQNIASTINTDNPDIIWISLGAPKQEQFMYRLRPYLNRGVMIAVGAAFKFFSGVDVKRAPKWMVDHHLEFVYRLSCEPKKQFHRCFNIVTTLPKLLYKEWKHRNEDTPVVGSQTTNQSQRQECRCSG